ncbi:Putative Vacuolar protein sorting-associated protein 1 [Rhizopus microsporus]|nr:Putative Vacuolar protein sorting-associated protein 1 [Rhizopus microsporus]
MLHIKNTLPEIKGKIQSALVKYQQELWSLGDPLDDQPSNRANMVLNIITEFCTEFRTIIDGTSGDLSSFELSGGARISFVFHELYASGVKGIDPLDQIKDVDIRTILYNSSGSSPALFVATTAFELIIKKQIKRLEEPSVKCINMVYDELVRILGQLLTKQFFKRFPALKEKFYQVVLAFFKKALQPTSKLVTDLVAMEACYINTAHPHFLNGHQAIALVNERVSKETKPKAAPATALPASTIPDSDNSGSLFGSFFSGNKKAANAKKSASPLLDAPPATLKASGNLSEREYMEIEVIKLLIQSYYDIVKRTMIDMVPKAIMLNLVNHAKEELQRELLTELYKVEVLDELLQESDFTRQRRNECKKMIEALQKADEIVGSV